MIRRAAPDRGISVARVTIQAADYEDSGIGILVAHRPLTLLVPSHLIELVEQGQSHAILINGVQYSNPKILPTPALQRDHLSILQFRKKRLRDLTSAQLPRQSVKLHPGQSISLQRQSPDLEEVGTVVEVRDRGDGTSVVTDIEVSTGDSGSPLLVSGRLAAICLGMMQREGGGTAVAVPLSHDGLSELRRLRRRYRVNLAGALSAALLAVALAFGGFAIYSTNTFALATIEVPEDGGMVVARNLQRLSLRPSWSRAFDTPIRRSQVFSSRVGSTQDRIAIGTAYQDDIDGAISILNTRGRVLWSYSVPDEECIYSTPELAYDGYLVDVIHPADLNGDGSTELLVSFVHDHYFPCKLVVFSADGEILAEYWHPGYIRTIATGIVGDSDKVLVVISASNNAIKTDWWNPQTLFAFQGLDISGQAPPYIAGSGGLVDLASANELWYWVIVNVDPESVRAKCKSFDIIDSNGDGLKEIRAPLTDGRFVYLNEHGEQLDVQLGDKFLQDFPDTPPPPLVDIDDYMHGD